MAVEEVTHLAEAARTTLKIGCTSLLASIVCCFWMTVYYCTPYSNFAPLYTIWQAQNPGKELSILDFPCPECVGGKLPENEFGFAYVLDPFEVQNALLGNLFMTDLGMCFNVFTQLAAIVGFTALMNDKRTRNGSLMIVAGLLLSSIILVGINAFSSGTAVIWWIRTLTYWVFGPLGVIYLWSHKVYPEAGLAKRVQYILNMALSGILAQLVAGLIFPLAIFPWFTNEKTSEALRALIAMFSPSIVLFISYSVGRLGGYLVDPLADHQGWGVIFFSTMYTSFYGRSLLIMTSGTALKDGLTDVGRHNMIVYCVVMELCRLLVRLLTHRLDTVLFRVGAAAGLKHDARQSIAPAARAPNPPARRRASTAEKTAEELEDEKPRDGETLEQAAARVKKEQKSKEGGGISSAWKRGQSVKSISRPSSMSARYDATDFIAESWCFVQLVDLTAITFAGYHVCIIEWHFGGIPWADAVSSMCINCCLQAFIHLVFMTIFTFVKSLKTQYSWHVAVDNITWPVVKMLMWSVFTLVPMFIMTTNHMVVRNYYRGLVYDHSLEKWNGTYADHLAEAAQAALDAALATTHANALVAETGGVVDAAGGHG